MKKGTKTIMTMVVLVCVVGGAAMAYQALKKQVTPQQQLVVESVGETVRVPVESSQSQAAVSTETGTQAVESTVAGTQAANQDSSNQKKMAPDFSVIDAQGNTVKLSDLAGKPVVLNFWASWCPPCKGEMPEFDMVYQELGDEVQFMMVDLTDGQRETVETAAKYIEDQGYALPIFFDTQLEAAYQYNVQSIPKTYFIDKDGYLVAGAQGAIDEEALRRGIAMIWQE